MDEELELNIEQSQIDSDISAGNLAEEHSAAEAEYDELISDLGETDLSFQDEEEERATRNLQFEDLGRRVQEASTLEPEKEITDDAIEKEMTPEQKKKQQEKIDKEAADASGFTGRVILGGIGDAAEGTVNAALDGYNWLEGKFGFNALPDDAKLDVMKTLVPAGNVPGEAFARSMVRFMTGFGAISKLVKGADTTNKIMKTTRGAAVGFMADFLTYDPEEENLAEMIKSSRPDLQFAILDYLAESDSNAEKRFKNGIEGLILGGMGWAVGKGAAKTFDVVADKIKPISEGFYNHIKFYKNVREFKKKIKAMEEVDRIKNLPPEVAKKETDALLKEADVIGKLLEKDMSPKNFVKAREIGEKLSMRGIKQPKMLRPPATKEETMKMLRELKYGEFAGDKAGNFSLKAFHTTEQARLAMRIAANMSADEIKMLKGGKMSIDVVNRLARRSNLQVEDILLFEQDKVLNAADTAKFKRILQLSAEEWVSLARLSEQGKVPFTKVQEAGDLLRDLTVKWSQVGTEQGRALAVRGQSRAGQMLYSPDIVGDLVNNMGEHNIAAMNRHLSNIGFDNFKTIYEAAERSTYMKWWDAVLEARIGAMLWSPTTQIKNVLSNTVITASAPIESGLAEIIGRINGRAFSGMAKAQYSAVYNLNTMMDAWRLASASMKTRTKHMRALAKKKGVPYEEISNQATKLEGFGQRAISSEKLGFTDPKTELGMAINKIIDITGDVVNLSGSALVSADEFFKTINRKGYVEKMWAEQADALLAQGRKAEELPALYDEFIRRPSTKKKAADFASYATLTQDLPEGTISKGLEKTIRATPLDRVTMPFLRVNLNSARYAVERIPLLAQMLPEVRAGLAAGGREADLVIAKQVFGGGVLAAAGALAYAGITTGAGPGNRDAFNMWRNVGGKQPYSIKVGSTWYPINAFGPLGDVFGLGADIASVLTYDGEGYGYSGSEIAQAAALALGNVYTPEFLTETIGEVLDIVQRGDEKAMEHFITQQPSLFIPNIVKRARRVVDPNKRVTKGDPDLPPVRRMLDGMIKQVMNSIPGLSDNLDMQVSRMGEPLMYPLGFTANMIVPGMTSVEKPSKVTKELMELGMFTPLIDTKLPDGEISFDNQKDITIGNLPKTISYNGAKIKLSTKEYLHFQRLASGIGLQGYPPIKDRLKALMANNWAEIRDTMRNEGDITAKKLEVAEIFDEYEAAAKGQMLETVLGKKMQKIDNKKNEGPKLR